MTFRIPGDDKRTIVIGRTGSGKTLFMRWLLSISSIETMPWIVFDYKQAGDWRIPYSKKLKLGNLPQEPGVYILNADFENDDAINAYLFEILRHGRIGVLFDEGASIPQREPRYKGLKSILAQGRGKRVPVIFGTQRPRYINNSLFSEGEFFARFDLSFAQDVEHVSTFLPEPALGPLDKFHCFWFDYAKNSLSILSPVDDETTLQRFEARLKPKRRLL